MKLFSRKTIFILLLIILSFPFIIKYTFVQHNQYIDIPLIRRTMDSSYLFSDWALNYNDLYSPRYFYARYIALQCRFLPLTAVYFINFLFAAALVAVATFYTAYGIFKSKTVSFLTVIAILFGYRYSFGGNDLIGRDLDPPKIASGLILAGFSCLLAKKHYIASVFFAAACYLHILIGLETPFILYTAFISAGIKFKKYGEIKSLLKSMGLYLFLSSYSIFSSFSSYFSGKNNDIDENLLIFILTKIRPPFHYLASTWQFSDYLVFISLIIFTFLTIRFYGRTINNKIKFLIGAFFILVIFLNITAYIFTEIWPIYSVIVLQLYRMNVFAFWLGRIIIYGECFYSTEKYVKKGRFKFISRLFAFIPFILTVPQSVSDPGPSHFVYLAASLIFCFFILRKFPKDAVPVIAALAIFFIPFRHYKIQFTQLYPVYTSEIDAAEWAKNNTEDDSVFLVPADFFFFKLNSQRSTIADLEDMPFHPGGIMEWFNRLKDISGLHETAIGDISRDKIIEGYRKTDAKRIEYLSGKYKLDYIILSGKTDLPYEIVYSNGDYRVFRKKY